jgi:glycosyltransferase involved in cell wall biosynthesis
MHILIVSRCPPWPLHLGDRLILFHLARELSRRGHTLDLFAFEDRPDLPDERDRYASFFREIRIIAAPVRSAGSLLMRALVPARRFPRNASQAWSAEMWDAVSDYIQSNTPDLVHLFGSIQVYELAQQVKPLPTVITPYESFTLLLRRQVAQSPFAPELRLRAWMSSVYERFMFAPFDHTVVVADRDRDELLRGAPDLPITVIPNGIDLSQFPPLDDAHRETDLILFSGNFEYGPNVQAAHLLATDILPRVRERHPQAKLALVGSAPPPDVRTLAGDHVVVTGHVPHMQTWLARAAVYVAPLMVGAGIKNKVLEAMAAGTPVVATPLSMDGIHARHGEEAVICTVKDMPSAVSDLLADAPRRQRLAAAARRLIETQFTWTAVADAYEKVYAAVTMKS